MKKHAFVRAALCELREQAETAAKRHPNLHHMLVLPPDEEIRIPPRPGVHALGCSQQKPPRITEFAGQRVACNLPPESCWPKLPPAAVVVAEQETPPKPPKMQEPYRVHLFFGDHGSISALDSLASDVVDLSTDLARSVPDLRAGLGDTVIYRSTDVLHGKRAERLDAWLCTLHWWAWKAVDSPIHTQPRIVFGGTGIEADRRDCAVRDKLSYSLLSVDVFTASSATLDLFIRFLDEPPALYWDADYPDVPKPETMSTEETAELIGQFVSYVTKYIQWTQLESSMLQTLQHAAPGSIPSADQLKRVENASGMQHEAAAQIRRYGLPLAEAMDKYGFDPAGVLSVVHCAGPHGGGANYVMPKWEETKVHLQSAAIKLRNGVGKSLPKDKPAATPAKPAPTEGGVASSAKAAAQKDVDAHIEQAISELLQSIPEKWAEFDQDALTETQARALFLLTAAGLVERRGTVRHGLFNHPVAVVLTYVATGEGGFAEAMEPMLAAMWPEWKDAWRQHREGETKESPSGYSESIGQQSWRLTEQGMIAHQDLQHGRQRVFDFVLKRGTMMHRPPVVGTGKLVRMEKVRSEVTSPPDRTLNIGNWTEGANAFAQAFAAMEAKASTPGNGTGMDGPAENPANTLEQQALNAAKILRTLQEQRHRIGDLDSTGWHGFRPSLHIGNANWTPLPFWEITYLAQQVRPNSKGLTKPKAGCLSGTGETFLDLMHWLGGNQYVECSGTTEILGLNMDTVAPGMVFGYVPPDCSEGLVCELWHHHDDAVIPEQRHALHWHLRWAKPDTPGFERGPRRIRDLADWYGYQHSLGDARCLTGLEGVAYLSCAPWYRLTGSGLTATCERTTIPPRSTNPSEQSLPGSPAADAATAGREPKEMATDQKSGDTPDATGLVADPTDKASYRAASRIIADNSDREMDYKRLNRILEAHPEIRRWKPSPQRLSVHLGDWHKYLDSRERTDDDWADNPAAVEKRKDLIRRQKDGK